MKNLPHDYYLKFLDPIVLDETLNFHTKTNFTIHESTQHISYLHNIESDTLARLTGNELSLYIDMDLTVKNQNLIPLHLEHPLHRNRSCGHFHDRQLEFNSIEKVISPLLTLDSNSYNRGYPSGGALYPIEVFICKLSEHVNGWPCEEKILHLLPHSRKMEIIQDSYSMEVLKRSILINAEYIGSPCVALIFTSYLPKTLFKYRYRGYRLAQLEAGSMYMLTDLMCKQLNLKTRLWSGYCDSMLTKCLHLNPVLFQPLCVQLIGA